VLHNVTISSTRIREALEKGDIDTANEYLGYPYFFDGIVVEGNKLGRTLGYPTANIEITNPHKLVPGNGVYAVQLSIVGVSLISENGGHNELQNLLKEGMMNIGVRPTVGGTKRVIEVNIFDFDKNIYGQNIRVYLKYFLRNELKFNGLDALKEQLAADKINAVLLFKKA
jgi:riboflavin kinase/FMN adenylyltransferase